MGGVTSMFGGKGGGGGPPVLDFEGFAQKQASANRGAWNRQLQANRPNQYTPWGSTTWDRERQRDPVSGKMRTHWTQTTKLDPELQRALDANMGLAGDRAELGRGLMGRLSDVYSEDVDYDQFGDPFQFRDQATDAAYEQATSRLDPMWNQQENDLEVSLRNQGLRPGTEAYDRAMGNFYRGRNDAYAGAERQAVQTGRDEARLGLSTRQQQIAEYLQERGLPIAEVNAIMAGTDPVMPTMPDFTAMGREGTPDYLGTAGMMYQSGLDRYNARQAQRQSNMSGMFNLAAAAIPLLPCDRRLKRNVKRIGDFRGYPLYEFEYVWGSKGIGPMADEVNQDAVSYVGGYAVVDLAKVV